MGSDRKLYQQVCSLGASMMEEAECGTNYSILGQWKGISRVNMTEFLPIVIADTSVTLSLRRTGAVNEGALLYQRRNREENEASILFYP